MALRQAGDEFIRKFICSNSRTFCLLTPVANPKLGSARRGRGGVDVNNLWIKYVEQAHRVAGRGL
jgi:hypothetical protein